GLYVAEGERARRQRHRAAVEHLQPPVDARASGPSRCPGPTSTSLVPQVIGGGPQAGETDRRGRRPGPARGPPPGAGGEGVGEGLVDAGAVAEEHRVAGHAVPSGMVTALPRRRRPPASFTPTLARMSPSLFNRRSRAARKGVAGQSQTGRVEVVVVVDDVVVGAPSWWWSSRSSSWVARSPGPGSPARRRDPVTTP